MPITINGSGTVTGISAGGLPDDCITTADIAAGAVTQAKRSEQLTLDTAKTATGTNVDFTGIPSWVKRVTVMLSGVSTSGTSGVLIQLGTSSGFATTGYNCIFSGITGLNATSTGTTTQGSIVSGSLATSTRVGSIVFSAIATNTFSYSGVTADSTNAHTLQSAGLIALSGTLTQLRLTSVNGTDTFDGGSINIMYE